MAGPGRTTGLLARDRPQQPGTAKGPVSSRPRPHRHLCPNDHPRRMLRMRSGLPQRTQRSCTAVGSMSHVAVPAGLQSSAWWTTSCWIGAWAYVEVRSGL